MNNKIKTNIKKIIPIITYSNFDICKNKIYIENRGKSGIYRLNNIVRGKSYVGSSIDLSRRFGTYYSLKAIKRILNRGRSAVLNSLLKHGHSNFSLEILEYSDSSTLIFREQYYIDLLKPEYNICKFAASPLGFKHSEETKAKMSVYNTGKNHTYETRKKIGLSLKSIIKGNSTPRVILSKTRSKLSLKSPGVSVKIYKSSILIKEFPTITSAAKYFDVSCKTISEIPNKGTYENFTFQF